MQHIDQQGAEQTHPGLAAKQLGVIQLQFMCAGGMPDLLLWNMNTCKAKLSEVKGPRDRLSEQQRAWINALIDAEVDVEVLKVVEPRQGSAPKRRRKW